MKWHNESRSGGVEMTLLFGRCFRLCAWGLVFMGDGDD